MDCLGLGPDGALNYVEGLQSLDRPPRAVGPELCALTFRERGPSNWANFVARASSLDKKARCCYARFSPQSVAPSERQKNKATTCFPERCQNGRNRWPDLA